MKRRFQSHPEWARHNLIPVRQLRAIVHRDQDPVWWRSSKDAAGREPSPPDFATLRVFATSQPLFMDSMYAFTLSTSE